MKDRYIFVVVFAVVCTVWSEDDLQDCNSKELSRCLIPFQAIGDNRNLGLAYTKGELDRLCPDVNRGLRCVDSFTGQCMTEEQRNDFYRLYQGPMELFKKLCYPGPFQEEFLAHAPCLEQANDGYKLCVLNFKQKKEEFDKKFKERIMGPTNGMSLESYSELRTACCSFRDYLTCLSRVVMQICGEEAAKIYDDFLNQFSSFLIKRHCESFDQCESSSANRNSPHAPLFPVFLEIVFFYVLRPT